MQTLTLLTISSYYFPHEVSTPFGAACGWIGSVSLRALRACENVRTHLVSRSVPFPFPLSSALTLREPTTIITNRLGLIVNGTLQSPLQRPLLQIDQGVYSASGAGYQPQPSVCSSSPKRVPHMQFITTVENCIRSTTVVLMVQFLR